ncbi:hypothetical protein [Catenuloplanes indicus]|uniref:Uncharacterized protein n=1 Tax=Catenuloplanes indicus TaxID=137267 RepID=A0AAE4B0B9_9ACTN|nr:hypothetical protein [Catenuloplanes indicus]MDQ0366678.1 hypothetical protein [Catenuloplanes indicus]
MPDYDISQPESTPAGTNTTFVVNSTDVVSALQTLINARQQGIEVRETAATRREEIRARRDIEIKRLDTAAQTVREYFDRAFAAADRIHDRLFEDLAKARETGDNATIQASLTAIVDVARMSPLATIGNLGELRRALTDPAVVVEF